MQGKTNHSMSADILGELSLVESERQEKVCVSSCTCSTCFESHSHLTRSAMN